MIDIGFVNDEAEARLFGTGLAPEDAIVNVKKQGRCDLYNFLLRNWPVQWGVWVALQEITLIWDFLSSVAATKAEALCLFDWLYGRRGSGACHNLQFPEYHGDFRVKRWIVMGVMERAVGRGELGLWVHRMITLREIRKSMVVRRWSMVKWVVIGSI